MEILSAVIRRLLASVGAVNVFARRLGNLILHLVLLEERRRSERLRNEGMEIQNIHAYEKLLAQHARLMLSLGHGSREVGAVVSGLMLRRLRAYQELHAMPEVKGLAPTSNGEDTVDRRFGERRHIRDRRRA